jgi:hypothetical protein
MFHEKYEKPKNEYVTGYHERRSRSPSPLPPLPTLSSPPLRHVLNPRRRLQPQPRNNTNHNSSNNPNQRTTPHPNRSIIKHRLIARRLSPTVTRRTPDNLGLHNHDGTLMRSGPSASDDTRNSGSSSSGGCPRCGSGSSSSARGGGL